MFKEPKAATMAGTVCHRILDMLQIRFIILVTIPQRMYFTARASDPEVQLSVQGNVINKWQPGIQIKDQLALKPIPVP